MIGLTLKQKQKQKNQQTCKQKLYTAPLASRSFLKQQKTQRRFLFFLNKLLSSIWLNLLVPYFRVVYEVAWGTFIFNFGDLEFLPFSAFEAISD